MFDEDEMALRGGDVGGLSLNWLVVEGKPESGSRRVGIRRQNVCGISKRRLRREVVDLTDVLLYLTRSSGREQLRGASPSMGRL